MAEKAAMKLRPLHDRIMVKRLEETLPLDEDGLEYIMPADGG